MLEHWQAIVAAIIVGGMGLVTRYVFVMKSDCEKHRITCNRTICAKIDNLQNRASVSGVQAIALDKEARLTLKEINISILTVSKDLAELKGAFDGLLHEFDRLRNI